MINKKTPALNSVVTIFFNFPIFPGALKLFTHRYDGEKKKNAHGV